MALKNRSGISQLSNEEIKERLVKAETVHADPITADTTIVQKQVPVKPEENLKLPRTGRKPTGNVKSASFMIYLTEEDAERLRAFCAKEDRTVSAWIRNVILREINQ